MIANSKAGANSDTFQGVLPLLPGLVLKKYEVRALIESESNVNGMVLGFALDLGLSIWKTNIGAQKIDGSLFRTHKIAIAIFFISDKLRKIWFFKEISLFADTSIEVVLRMPLLSFNNINNNFKVRELIWSKYLAIKALPINSRVQLMSKHKYGKAALDKNVETFVVHMAALKAAMLIYLS